MLVQDGRYNWYNGDSIKTCRLNIIRSVLSSISIGTESAGHLVPSEIYPGVVWLGGRVSSDKQFNILYSL